MFNSLDTWFRRQSVARKLMTTALSTSGVALMAAKPAQKILFFYCYQCGDYEPKTSPHFRNQRRRLARRKKAREAEGASSINGNSN